MRRLAVVLLVLAVVLVAGGAVADRVVHARVEEELAAQVRERVDVEGGPEVVVDGFPFLTQVLAGRLSEIRGRAPSLVADGLELQDVRVAARGVTPREPYRAETVEINADIPVSTLRDAFGQGGLPGLPLQVEVADGLLQVGIDAGGLELDARVEPVIVDGAVGLRLEDISVGTADVPQEVIDLLEGALRDVRLEIPGLSDGLEPTRLAVGRDGLELRLEGRDVELGSWIG